MGEGGWKGSLVGRLALLQFYLRLRFKDLLLQKSSSTFFNRDLRIELWPTYRKRPPAVCGFTLAVLIQMRGKQGALWEICKWRKANKMVTAWYAVYEYITDHFQFRIRSAEIRTPFLQACVCYSSTKRKRTMAILVKKMFA